MEFNSIIFMFMVFLVCSLDVCWFIDMVCGIEISCDISGWGWWKLKYLMNIKLNLFFVVRSVICGNCDLSLESFVKFFENFNKLFLGFIV